MVSSGRKKTESRKRIKGKRESSAGQGGQGSPPRQKVDSADGRGVPGSRRTNTFSELTNSLLCTFPKGPEILPKSPSFRNSRSVKAWPALPWKGQALEKWNPSCSSWLLPGPAGREPPPACGQGWSQSPASKGPPGLSSSSHAKSPGTTPLPPSSSRGGRRYFSQSSSGKKTLP